MGQTSIFLVFGATGGTGQHFVSQALDEGHKIRVLAQNPAKLVTRSFHLHVVEGSIADTDKLDSLVHGCDFVVSMLGDVKLQKEFKINTAFIKQLVPIMRRHTVKRMLY